MADEETETTDRPFTPDPLDVYGHINLRDIGDQHLVQQSPVFAQARAAALNPDASAEELAVDEPNLAGFDLQSNAPVTVLDGEAIADRQAEEDQAERERAAELTGRDGSDEPVPGTGPSAAGVRTPDDGGQPDRKEQAQAERDKPGAAKSAVKKVASKVTGHDK